MSHLPSSSTVPPPPNSSASHNPSSSSSSSSYQKVEKTPVSMISSLLSLITTKEDDLLNNFNESHIRELLSDSDPDKRATAIKRLLACYCTTPSLVYNTSSSSSSSSSCSSSSHSLPSSSAFRSDEEGPTYNVLARVFPDVIKAITTQDLQVKMLVYAYLTLFASSNKQLTLLSINCLQRDIQDHRHPLLRAAALKSLCTLPLLELCQIMLQAVKKGASDPSPWVRLTAARATWKVYLLDEDMFDRLRDIIMRDMIGDVEVCVVGAAVTSLSLMCHVKMCKCCRISKGDYDETYLYKQYTNHNSNSNNHYTNTSNNSNTSTTSSCNNISSSIGETSMGCSPSVGIIPPPPPPPVIEIKSFTSPRLLRPPSSYHIKQLLYIYQPIQKIYHRLCQSVHTLEPHTQPHAINLLLHYASTFCFNPYLHVILHNNTTTTHHHTDSTYAPTTLQSPHTHTWTAHNTTHTPHHNTLHTSSPPSSPLHPSSPTLNSSCCVSVSLIDDFDDDDNNDKQSSHNHQHPPVIQVMSTSPHLALPHELHRLTSPHLNRSSSTTPDIGPRLLSRNRVGEGEVDVFVDNVYNLMMHSSHPSVVVSCLSAILSLLPPVTLRDEQHNTIQYHTTTTPTETDTNNNCTNGNPNSHKSTCRSRKEIEEDRSVLDRVIMYYKQKYHTQDLLHPILRCYFLDINTSVSYNYTSANNPPHPTSSTDSTVSPASTHPTTIHNTPTTMPSAQTSVGDCRGGDRGGGGMQLLLLRSILSLCDILPSYLVHNISSFFIRSSIDSSAVKEIKFKILLSLTIHMLYTIHITHSTDTTVSPHQPRNTTNHSQMHNSYSSSSPVFHTSPKTRLLATLSSRRSSDGTNMRGGRGVNKSVVEERQMNVVIDEMERYVYSGGGKQFCQSVVQGLTQIAIIASGKAMKREGDGDDRDDIVERIGLRVLNFIVQLVGSKSTMIAAAGIVAIRTILQQQQTVSTEDYNNKKKTITIITITAITAVSAMTAVTALAIPATTITTATTTAVTTATTTAITSSTRAATITAITTATTATPTARSSSSITISIPRHTISS
eukprot:GHVQ01017908.1.p1 GENE.GHVQ01017908.1~~GHVQ01017908.1.p1  ORF type:complete len:1060 (-),score=252.56 GHVQ01017908.1:407-3586(-)